MTTRERKLASTLAVMLISALGFLFAKYTYFDPARKIEKEKRLKEDLEATRQGEIRKEIQYMEAINKLSPRLGQWEKLSLPEGTGTSDAAKASHLSLISGQYREYLADLMDKCKIKKRQLAAGKIETKSSQGGRASDRKTYYQSISYEIEGDGTLEGIKEFFKALYAKPLLHQVKKFTIQRVQSEKDPKMLFVKMTVEVLMVPGAEKMEGKKRPGIEPVFSGSEKGPTLLASLDRSYDETFKKTNMFIPPDPKKVEDKEPVASGEDPRDVFPNVKLTFIAQSEYYDSWIAQVTNASNKGDNFAVLLADKPLTKNSRFQKEKDAATKAKTELPREPTAKWVVKDFYDETLADLQVVRIEERDLIFQMDGKMYRLSIGESLAQALEEPLSEETVRKLGLSVDRDSVLSKVVLRKLDYNKDRKGFEALFINGENKDEERVLATEPDELEVVGPDTWMVLDRFSKQVMKVTVVKVDKDRLVFIVPKDPYDLVAPWHGSKQSLLERMASMSDKDYFSLKAGENLANAMKKALSEDEVKKLGLKK